MAKYQLNNIQIIGDYVLLKPKKKVKIHHHKMPHIISGMNPFQLCIDSQIKEGRTAIIPSDIFHSILSMDQNTKMLLVMPLTDLYFQINELLKKECVISEKYQSIEEMVEYFRKSGITCRTVIKDNRVIDIIDKICMDSFEEKTVTEIAACMNLSESRLEHLFSEKTGIRLKHYLLLNKLRKAYQQVCDGKSITEAAYEGGFSDSSHLAVVSKRLMGISVRDVFGKI